MMRLAKAWMMRFMGLPSCQEVERFAYDYLEEKLDGEVARKFERHLRGCRSCENFVRSYRAVAEPERLTGRIELDPDFEARVVGFLRRYS
jgi:hypothetical protein